MLFSWTILADEAVAVLIEVAISLWKSKLFFCSKILYAAIFLRREDTGSWAVRHAARQILVEKAFALWISSDGYSKSGRPNRLTKINTQKCVKMLKSQPYLESRFRIFLSWMFFGHVLGYSFLLIHSLRTSSPAIGVGSLLQQVISFESSNVHQTQCGFTLYIVFTLNPVEYNLYGSFFVRI